MPFFSGLPRFSRERGAMPKSETPQDEDEGFSALEEDFFAQGESKKEMKKSSAERLSDLEIAQRERETGHLEREVLARGEIVDMLNTLKRTGNLDSGDQTPEVKVAFLRNLTDQFKAKKAALKTMQNVPLDEVRRINKEISNLEALQVKYGMEIDFDGGPDGGEELTLDEEEEEGEESLAA